MLGVIVIAVLPQILLIKLIPINLLKVPASVLITTLTLLHPLGITDPILKPHRIQPKRGYITTE